MDAGITESKNNFETQKSDMNNSTIPMTHGLESHEREIQEPQSHEIENHELEYPDTENHEPEKQAHFEQQNTHVNEFHLEDVVPQVYTKRGFIARLKDIFRRKSQVQLRRESKWRKVRSGTGDKVQKKSNISKKKSRINKF